ncbi:MAG: sporulation protein YabP [Oscillospiraceae bacterium]|nr:sporulation protein YabP [Oscillospiraceae bacterium]
MAYAFSEPQPKSHKLSLEDRSKLVVTGVEDVESFDEQTVVLVTSQGVLVIRGSDLHLRSLSLEGGGVTVDGQVDALSYELRQSPGGFFSRLLH